MLTDFLLFVTVIAVVLTATGALGMTLLPRSLAASEDRLSLALISPLAGSAAWIAVPVALGPLVGFTRTLALVLLAVAAAWVVWRRDRVFFPLRARACALVGALIVLLGLVGALLMPREIDGGLYFVPSMYDHVKCMIIRSIAEHGLPPVNPWLADGGAPVAMVYYYGYHAWAAQLMMLSGLGSLYVEIAMVVATAAVCILGTGALAGLIAPSRKGPAVVLAVAFTIFVSGLGFLRTVLPDAVTGVPDAGFNSYWDVADNLLWAPQHCISATVILAVVWLYLRMLSRPDRRSGLPYAALIGVLAAAAAMTSVYSGCFVLAFLGLFFLGFLAFCPEFRRDFRRHVPAQILAAAVFAVLAFGYLLFLAQGQVSDVSPLAFGPDTCYSDAMERSGWIVVALNFLLYVLPWRLGADYVLALAAVAIPGALPRTRLARTFVFFAALSLLLPLLFHSTFYSNDFGWRFIQPAEQLMPVFSSVFLVRLLGRRRLAWLGVALILVTAVLAVVNPTGAFNFKVRRESWDEHRAFARAVPGWRTVRRIAGPRDLVLSNPAGFPGIGGVCNADKTTNLFLSLYAERNSPIGDLVFAKCYSEFYDGADLERRFNRVKGIFAGNPRAEDADYLADDLKVRAILVTTEDGLYRSPGAIGERYDVAEETPGYRVYGVRK